jgi:hypothetical protein
MKVGRGYRKIIQPLKIPAIADAVWGELPPQPQQVTPWFEFKKTPILTVKYQKKETD